MKQNGAPIANYYSNLTEIFQELDQLSPTNMKDPDDISSRQQEIERLRVYIFLAGLDNKFDQICGEILRMEPKLGLEGAYSHVKHESNRQGTMSKGATMPEATCTKCGLKNHTIQGCYEIIGYLEGWVHKGRKKESSRVSFTTSESSQDVSSSDHVSKALNTSANQTFITSANGSISPVTGECSLSLTSSLNLDHVLVGRDWLWY
ncbi:hypothetical protein ACFX12_046144 [Malus domestica]